MIYVLQIAGDGYGGVEHVIQNYYEYIDKTKVKFDILYHGENDEFVIKMQGLGCKVYLQKKPSQIGIIDYYKSINDILKKNRYDVVHVHALQYIGIVLFAALKNGVKRRVAHIHNSYINKDHSLKEKIVFYYIRNSIILLATEILTCSKNAAKSYIGENEKTKMLYNAINSNLYIKEDKDYLYSLKKKLNIGDKKVIGHIGRFVEQKNHKFILEIASKMKMDKNYVFVMVGDGPCFDKIKIQAKQMELNNIIFMGNRDDVPKLLHLFDLMILPSLHEGLPVTMIECQVAGIPLIVADNITREVDLHLDMITFLSIDNVEIWREKIIKNVGQHIPGDAERMEMQKKAGYGIIQQADQLLKVYLH